ncbi:hypothetical protein FB45DRAFT_883356 [Roridomyces roridus]|uniref:Uncharacterized protein n=1 Tax=Roridomyces roridus TaxID=1738132 RepID=A0AAD7F7E0_9AGAR|nr:hypothetical protein FB45DRAFT_883356 [Roridomyces roridus]
MTKLDGFFFALDLSLHRRCLASIVPGVSIPPHIMGRITSKKGGSAKPSKTKRRSNYKYCHCRKTCGKLISERTRRDHYRLVPLHSIRASVSPDHATSDEGSDNEMDTAPALPFDHRFNDDSDDDSAAPVTALDEVQSDWDYDLEVSAADETEIEEDVDMDA